MSWDHVATRRCLHRRTPSVRLAARICLSHATHASGRRCRSRRGTPPCRCRRRLLRRQFSGSPSSPRSCRRWVRCRLAWSAGARSGRRSQVDRWHTPSNATASTPRRSSRMLPRAVVRNRCRTPPHPQGQFRAAGSGIVMRPSVTARSAMELLIGSCRNWAPCFHAKSSTTTSRHVDDRRMYGRMVSQVVLTRADNESRRHRDGVRCPHADPLRTPVDGVGRFPNLAGAPAGPQRETLHCCRRAYLCMDAARPNYRGRDLREWTTCV
jgi:hypothetical protein